MIEILMAEWGLLTLGVWVLTETLSHIPFIKARVHTNFLALMIGTFGAVVLSMGGVFVKPEGVSDIWWVGAMVFLAAIAVSSAGIANDKIFRPVKQQIRHPPTEKSKDNEDLH